MYFGVAEFLIRMKDYCVRYIMSNDPQDLSVGDNLCFPSSKHACTCIWAKVKILFCFKVH